MLHRRRSHTESEQTSGQEEAGVVVPAMALANAPAVRLVGGQREVAARPAPPQGRRQRRRGLVG